MPIRDLDSSVTPESFNCGFLFLVAKRMSCLKCVSI